MMRRSVPCSLHWNGRPVKGWPGDDLYVTSPLTFTQATKPHNTQEAPSCSFISGLSCAQRHRMLGDKHLTLIGKTKRVFFPKGKPAKSIVADFKKDVPSGISHDKGGNLTGADPYAFADYLFHSVDKTTLKSEDRVNTALKEVKRSPCIFPYLPVTRRGQLVVYNKEEWVGEYHSKFQEKAPIWHTQCIVGAGINAASGQEYFVCLQSWKDSVLTFIPAMSSKEILEFNRLPENKGKPSLFIPYVHQIPFERDYLILIPSRLKENHAPSDKEFTATKRSGMLVPPVHTGYFPPGRFT